MLAEAVIDDRISPSALVTGGASGYGKAVCEALRRDGYLVAVADRDEVGARAVADACGGIAVAVDLADETSVIAMVSRARDSLAGKLDAMAIAGPSNDAGATFDDAAALGRAHALYVVGTHLSISLAAEAMEPGGRICIVAPASADPRNETMFAALHAAVRGAVMALTRHAAQSLRAREIAVNAVTPSALAAASAVADAVAWLLSPRSASVSGEIIAVGSP